MHGWAPEVIGAVGAPETNPQGYLSVFFAPTDTSREAGRQAAGRIFGRTTDRDEPTTWQTRQAQYDAVCAWGIPNHSLLERVAAIDLPVFVANGDSDPMILPRYSYLLAGLLPNARLTIYPDSAHGFLFQHHSQFAADVHAFLEDAFSSPERPHEFGIGVPWRPPAPLDLSARRGTTLGRPGGRTVGRTSPTRQGGPRSRSAGFRSRSGSPHARSHFARETSNPCSGNRGWPRRASVGAPLAVATATPS